MLSFKELQKHYRIEFYWILFQCLLTCTLAILYIFHIGLCLEFFTGSVSNLIPVVIHNQYMLVAVLYVSLLSMATLLVDFIRYRSFYIVSIACPMFGLGLVFAFDAGKYGIGILFAILGFGVALLIIQCIVELVQVKQVRRKY